MHGKSRRTAKPGVHNAAMSTESGAGKARAGHARMLALGAKGVLLGRAWAYALGAEGQAGVAHMLDLLEKELRVAMALTGCTRIAEIGPECLVRR